MLGKQKQLKQTKSIWSSDLTTGFNVYGSNIFLRFCFSLFAQFIHTLFVNILLPNRYAWNVCVCVCDRVYFFVYLCNKKYEFSVPKLLQYVDLFFLSLIYNIFRIWFDPHTHNLQTTRFRYYKWKWFFFSGSISALEFCCFWSTSGTPNTHINTHIWWKSFC